MRHPQFPERSNVMPEKGVVRVTVPYCCNGCGSRDLLMLIKLPRFEVVICDSCWQAISADVKDLFKDTTI